MIWLTWRQFRVQALAGLALLVVFTLYLLYAGYAIRQAYDTDVLGCVAADGCNLADATDRFLRDHTRLVAAPGLLLAVLPAIIGIFWGAPLITRELETNTHRLAWNQSVTRTRWLAVKLAIVGLASVFVTGALSLLLTWAASRYDQAQGNRFDALLFATRNIVPLGYAAFAVVLGATVGLFVRRTVTAMAVTLLVVGIAQLLMPTVVRPVLRPPVVDSVAYDEATREHNGFLAIGRDQPVMVIGYTVPGAWMLSSVMNLRTASGEKVYTSQIQDCLRLGRPGPAAEPDGADSLERCVARRDLHFDVSYQPASRYWSFQWLELGGFLGLAALLAGVAFWRIRRVRG